MSDSHLFGEDLLFADQLVSSILAETGHYSFFE